MRKLFKFITKIITFVLVLYLSIFIIYTAFAYTNKKNNNVKMVNILGYSIYVNENNKLLPDIRNGELVILKLDDKVEVGDYVCFKNSYDKIKFKKVIEIQDETYIVDFNNKTDNSQEEIIDFNLLGVAIYYNPKLTKIYNIVTNWYVIGAMVLFIFFSPQLFYKRYE